MLKLSRRDHLKQLGVGAAGLIALSKGDVLATSWLSHRITQTPGISRWNPTPTLPSNARVTVILDGLMGFFYNANTRNTEIGMLHGMQTSSANHMLKVEVWERMVSNSSCNLLFSTVTGTLPAPGPGFAIEIVGKQSSTAFYQEGPYDRPNLQPKDFRWLPDLEGEDFYPNISGGLQGNYLRLRFTVRHGTFYTFQKTKSTFQRIDLNPNTATPAKDLGPVAKVIAVGLEPATNEEVFLRINPNSTVIFQHKPGYTHEVVIRNHCHKSNHDLCDFDPDHPTNEESRNDFHYLRKLLPLAANSPIFSLKIKAKGRSQIEYCSSERFKTEQERGSDRSPCMGAGFGGEGGYP